MTPAVRDIILFSKFSPYGLPNLAARYDLSRLDSLIYDGSNRLQLCGDLSGNSAVNGLVLNGVSGNYASTPDSAALSVTGDIDLRAYVSLASWTPAADNRIIAKFGSAGARSYGLEVIASTGLVRIRYSSDGTNQLGASSTIAPTVSNFGAIWIRATFDVDNGAAGNTATFYTSPDGVTWTQLGTPVVQAGVASIFDSAQALNIGSSDNGTFGMVTGNIYRAQIYNGIGGTLVYDANFTTAAKLASTFTESSVNAATVTINTSGDTGARICGARDGLEMTQLKQPILTISASGNYATYDGSNDYTKSAPYSASQPRTRITVANAIAWNSGNILWDGNTAGSSKLLQTGVTPNLQLNAGSAGPQASTFVLGNFAIMVEVINGAPSTIQRNADAPSSTANAGATAANGTTIGGDGAGANNANIAVAERLEFSVVLDAATIARVVQFYSRKYAGLLSLP